jgi:hypothetical protein
MYHLPIKPKVPGKPSNESMQMLRPSPIHGFREASPAISS